jgi:hypothetical protein
MGAGKNTLRPKARNVNLRRDTSGTLVNTTAASGYRRAIPKEKALHSADALACSSRRFRTAPRKTILA